MGVLFSQERRQWAPEPVVPPFPGWTGGTATSIRTKEEALAVSTVWDCVGTIANSVSLMALETFTHNPTGVPARVPDPPIVTAPSAGLTQSDFLHQVMVSLLLRGNSYGHIVDRDRMLRPQLIELQDPDQVSVRLVDGAIEYRFNGTVVPTQDVWHMRGMTLPGSKVGLSPIAYGAAQMGVELSAVKFAKDFFDGGGIPKAVLESEHEIGQEVAKTLKERLMAATRNREPIALGYGVKYTAISVKPDEAQFIATQQNAVATVARFFFMNPEMVGGSSGNSMTYANREQRAIDYVTYTVSHWLKRVEDAYFRLLPGADFVQFNERNLLRTDAETQAKVDAIRVASKVLPPSRILKALNEAPLTDDEKAELELVPMTVTPTGMPKAATHPPTPGTNADVPDVEA